MNTPHLSAPKYLVKVNLAKAVFCAALAPLFLSTHAMGASVIWDTTATQVDANDPTQVSTVGTLITAVAFSSTTTAGYNSVGTSQTINGVTFNCLPLVANTPGVPHAVSANASLSFQAGGGNAGGSPSTAYTSLFDTGIYQPDTSSSVSPLIFNGLVVGHTYVLQVWNSYWPTPTNTVRFSPNAPTLSGGSYHATDESATLLVGQTSTSLTPQFTFGTFTADATTQNFYWYGDLSNYGIFGAFQLREVPEPSTIALLAFSGLALIVRRRIRIFGRPELVSQR